MFGSNEKLRNLLDETIRKAEATSCLKIQCVTGTVDIITGNSVPLGEFEICAYTGGTGFSTRARVVVRRAGWTTTKRAYGAGNLTEIRPEDLEATNSFAIEMAGDIRRHRGAILARVETSNGSNHVVGVCSPGGMDKTVLVNLQPELTDGQVFSEFADEAGVVNFITQAWMKGDVRPMWPRRKPKRRKGR